MRSLIRNAFLGLLFSSFAMTASAHPGHGEPGPAHYMTSPQHLATVAIFLLALSILGVFALRGRAKA